MTGSRGEKNADSSGWLQPLYLLGLVTSHSLQWASSHSTSYGRIDGEVWIVTRETNLTFLNDILSERIGMKNSCSVHTRGKYNRAIDTQVTLLAPRSLQILYICRSLLLSCGDLMQRMKEITQYLLIDLLGKRGNSGRPNGNASR